VHVPAVKPNSERHVGPRELLPVALAAVDEHRLLGTELGLKALGRGLRVAADAGRLQYSSEQQQLAQQPGAETVRDQPGELGLKVEQLWRAPLGQDLSQRAERLSRLGATGAMNTSAGSGGAAGRTASAA